MPTVIASLSGGEGADGLEADAFGRHRERDQGPRGWRFPGDLVAKFPEAVYVLHAFEKKTGRTPKADTDLANDRYRAMMNERKQR